VCRSGCRAGFPCTLKPSRPIVSLLLDHTALSSSRGVTPTTNNCFRRWTWHRGGLPLCQHHPQGAGTGSYSTLRLLPNEQRVECVVKTAEEIRADIAMHFRTEVWGYAAPWVDKLLNGAVYQICPCARPDSAFENRNWACSVGGRVQNWGRGTLNAMYRAEQLKNGNWVFRTMHSENLMWSFTEVNGSVLLQPAPALTGKPAERQQWQLVPRIRPDQPPSFMIVNVNNPELVVENVMREDGKIVPRQDGREEQYFQFQQIFMPEATGGHESVAVGSRLTNETNRADLQNLQAVLRLMQQGVILVD